MCIKYIVLSEKSAYSKVFSVKPEPITTLWFMLHQIDDPRRPQGKRHDLPLVLCLAILAICCGCESYQAMEEWSDNYQDLLKQLVPFLSRHTPLSLLLVNGCKEFLLQKEVKELHWMVKAFMEQVFI